MGALSDAQETSHDIDDSVTVHNINNAKATVKWPTYLTASVEELSTRKETVHDIPTTAPTVPSDLPLVNIQSIVPQDTAIILKMGGYKVTRLQGYKVCVCVQIQLVHVPLSCCHNVVLGTQRGKVCYYSITHSSAPAQGSHVSPALDRLPALPLQV